MNWRRRHDESRRRSASELLSSISTLSEREPARPPERSEIVANEPNANRANVYRVLWAKPSSRKKRVWEGDGTLEVEGNVATLYDEDGRALAAGSAPSRHLLVGDSSFMVGGKLVEIVEQLLNSGSKRATSEREQNTTKNPKKRRPNNVPHVACPRAPEPIHRERVEPLSLLAPPSEHQWKHNEPKRPITVVTVDAFLTSHLRPHQREGVSFLYECVMGFRSEHTGAILADEMGLGKTLQSVALIWTLLSHGPYGSAVIKRALIIAPSTLCANWEKEFLKWLGRERLQPFLIDNNKKPKDFSAQRISPVMIISYERLVKHVEDIENINFHLIVCDEAHRLKNSNIKIAQCLSKLSCKRRILLTGTPFQNDFQEYFVLVDVANSGILGTYKEFKENYEEPIVLSRNSNCSKEEHEIGESKAAHLHFLTSNFILRRTQSVLEKILPTKTEYVIFCYLTNVQKEIYVKAIDEWWINREFASASPLRFITYLKKICNHPSLLTMRDDVSEEFSSVFQKHINTSSHSLKDATKVTVLRKLLKNVITKGEKVVIVSNSTMMLNILARECDLLDFSYLRLDGSTPVQSRQNIVNSFNSNFKKTDGSKIHSVLLLSSRAGGVGLSLPGASHLVLYDSDWNPAVDNQAMARIWRDGQKNPVHIYRFLCTGTIEEKIYQRQIYKTNLSDTVMQSTGDSPIKLSEADLKDLFSVNFDSECITHDMIECKCQGNGDPEIENLSDSEENIYQGGINSFISKYNTSKINNLYEWEHFRSPFDSEFLRESSLEGIMENISFIFRKICHK